MPLNLPTPAPLRAVNRSNRQNPYRCENPSYTEAKWNNIPFHVESSSDEFGRRGDVYEYPLGEDIGYKDLGRRARRYKIEGYLLGDNQAALTRQMCLMAEEAGPKSLNHPMWGENILVACVTLTTNADYRKDKKRTRLSFEFVEASSELSPFAAGKSMETVWKDATGTIDQSLLANASRTVDQPTAAMTDDIKRQLSGKIDKLSTNEKSLDARDILLGQTSTGAWQSELPTGAGAIEHFAARARAVMPRPATAANAQTPVTFASLIAPINYAMSVIREYQFDALPAFREFNKYVVERAALSPTAEAIIMTIRLIILRDYAIAASRKSYPTIRDALDDLDFIVASYDDEEEIAAQQCEDVLVNLIRAARAAATSSILTRNIRLPGIVVSSVDGVWPSVVVAWKLYADSRRYGDVEAYNPAMSSFWMGRDVVAPAR